MPFVELIIVLFVILAVITRFLTLYLLRKYRKLREDFDNARRAQSSEAANLRREIARAANASWRLLPPRRYLYYRHGSSCLLPRRNLLKRRLCRQRVPHLACRSQRCPPQRELPQMWNRRLPLRRLPRADRLRH